MTEEKPPAIRAMRIVNRTPRAIVLQSDLPMVINQNRAPRQGSTFEIRPGELVSVRVDGIGEEDFPAVFLYEIKDA